MDRKKLKRQAIAEAYGMGDIKIGQQITGQYPNRPVNFSELLKEDRT